MSRQWTQEQRAALSAQIHNWQPWKHSTGPKSPEGKAVVSRNAWKGGRRPSLRWAIKVLKLELKAAQVCGWEY